LQKVLKTILDADKNGCYQKQAFDCGRKNSLGGLAMTKDEVMKLLVLIESVYSNCSIKDETVLQWFQLCAEMDYEKILARLKTHIRKSPFPPRIGEIAVFTYEENHSPATLQEWMKRGREAMECDRISNKRTSLPHWLAEYSPRKSV
jgi:hypothetical protein